MVVPGTESVLVSMLKDEESVQSNYRQYLREAEGKETEQSLRLPLVLCAVLVDLVIAIRSVANLA